MTLGEFLCTNRWWFFYEEDVVHKWLDGHFVIIADPGEDWIDGENVIDYDRSAIRPLSDAYNRFIDANGYRPRHRRSFIIMTNPRGVEPRPDEHAALQDNDEPIGIVAVFTDVVAAIHFKLRFA